MPTSTRFFRLRLLVLLELAVLAASLMMAVVLASPAQAASLTVTTRGDELNNDGDCSLREAIEAANTNAAVDGCAAGSGAALDTIVFAVGRDRTLTVGSELPIADDAGLTINGQTKNITISGNDATRVLGVENGAVFNLKNLTVADGNATFNGGAIENLGGTITVTNSTFSGNSADLGGGILNSGGTLKVINSTFSGNSAAGINGGGGIYNENGTLTVSNSTFSGNTSGGDGGGIINTGTLTVTKSTFSGNSAGGNGGGIDNAGGATLKVINSTLYNNSADLGGGIMNQSSLVVTNSTFSDNSATTAGGGLYVELSTPTLKNTIVANSTQGGVEGGDCFLGFAGALTDGGFNLIEDGSCITKASSRSGDPNLGALADNGGLTQTMALQAGSKAIDKGKAFGLTTDQRGLPRPSDDPLITNRADGSDIGAFEVQQ